MTRIKKERKSLGLTQLEAARLMGLAQAQLSRIEGGDRCGVKVRARICEFLELEPCQLFDMKGFPKYVQ